MTKKPPMPSVGPQESTTVQPIHVLQGAIFLGVVGGGYLLLSAEESRTLIDGAVEWSVQSPLRAVVQLLCLNYAVPTPNAGDVKNFLLGLGAGLSALLLAARLLGSRTLEIQNETPETPGGNEHQRRPSVPSISDIQRDDDPPPDLERLRLGSVERPPTSSSLQAAGAFVVLFLLWSLAGSRWSTAPELALGATLLLGMQFLWSYTLFRNLNAASALYACRVWIGITCATTLVALWYYYGRNWSLRAKFPFGNPNFLAACLIPGILLSVAALAEYLEHRRSAPRRNSTVPAALGVVGLFLGVWTMNLTGSRGPAVGLVAGLMTMAWLGARVRARRIIVLIAITGLVAGTLYLRAGSRTPSPTGRDATLRFRMYAWSYAWDMFREHPLLGHGQGAYVLGADARSTQPVDGMSDVLRDPVVFQSRIEHAHNEWLEILADLGLVGALLMTAILILTGRSAMVGLNRSPSTAHRWVLMALTGSLVALIVDAAMGVGIRVSGVPTAWYTTIGLIWCLSSVSSPPAPTTSTAPRRISRILRCSFAGTAGLLALVLAQQDFSAARATYRAQSELAQQNYENAVRAALASTSRLNPQRAITNLLLLAEAQTRNARTIQIRGLDREHRARTGSIVDRNLMTLALRDRAEAEHWCAQASRSLTTLVARSPGFINHGRVEYMLNRVLADQAGGAERPDSTQAFLRNGRSALERELRRQPFDPTLAAEFVRESLNEVPMDELMTYLARPLRLHGVRSPYPELLIDLSSRPAFAEWKNGLSEQLDDLRASPPEDWRPERIRLAAAASFLSGDQEGALRWLEQGAALYANPRFENTLARPYALAELADARFFGHPDDPERAIEAARQALDLTPPSFPGRDLARLIHDRLILYYLAADRESDARSALRFLNADIPPDRELSERYRRLCEAIMGRPVGQILRKPVDDLLPVLRRWAYRALELNDENPRTLLLAADLDLYAGQDQDSARNLEQALHQGLPPEVARRFLEVARERSTLPRFEELWRNLPSSPEPSPESINKDSEVHPPGSDPFPPERPINVQGQERPVD